MQAYCLLRQALATRCLFISFAVDGSEMVQTYRIKGARVVSAMNYLEQEARL